MTAVNLKRWKPANAWKAFCALSSEANRPAGTPILPAAGVRPCLYRAPFGLLRPGQARRLRALGYEPVLGDIYPVDVRCRRPDPIVARVMRRLAAGSIVILHDASVLGDGDREVTIAAVETILREAAARGLSAVTVSEMICGAGSAGGAPRQELGA